MKYKISFLVIILLTLVKNTTAQEYINRPELDKFSGFWHSINGNDTIRLACFARYIGNNDVKLKTALLYFEVKQGSQQIWANFTNATNDNLADMGGAKCNGSNKDTLIVVGKDFLKRKNDEGILIINANATQLKFVRKIGITGGGLNVYKQGQEPLTGYTLPSEIVFTKIEFTEMKQSH